MQILITETKQLRAPASLPKQNSQYDKRKKQKKKKKKKPIKPFKIVGPVSF